MTHHSLIDSATAPATTRRTRRRTAMALVATLLASMLSVVVLAGSASAATPCYSLARRAATTNVLGQVTHAVTNEIYFCSNTATGRLTYVQTRATHQEAYLWNWVSWNGNFKQGGVGYTSFTYYIQGSFKECASYCFNSASNYVKITVYANGTYAVSGH